MDEWTIDVKQWGDGLIYFAGVSGALFALWKMWFKSIVSWIHDQGETNTAVARVVTTELPKMTKAIERVSEVQRDHGRLISDHGRLLESIDGRVAKLEGGSVSASDITITQRRRRGVPQ